MPSALATAREDLISRIGDLYGQTTHEGADIEQIRKNALNALVGAEKLVRGPENCVWKLTVAGLRSQLESNDPEARLRSQLESNDPEARRSVDWALAQYSVYLVHALDAPAALPKPARRLDPNSETYMCM